MFSVESPAQHRLFHLLGDDRPDLAQVFPDRLDLAGDPHQEFEVGFQVADRLGEVALLPILVALGDEVVDVDLRRLLPVAVDAPVALLHAVGVPRDFVVDQPGAVVLQVQPLAGGVGGEQDAHRADVGGGLEGGFDGLPVVRVHAAVHGQQPVAAR